MKLLLGLLLGLATSALAQDAATTKAPIDLGIASSIYLKAGVGPDNKASIIKTDSNGHVICSEDFRGYGDRGTP